MTSSNKPLLAGSASARADVVLFVGPRSTYDLSLGRAEATTGFVVASTPVSIEGEIEAPWALMIQGLPTPDAEWIAVPKVPAAWAYRQPEWWAVKDVPGSPVGGGSALLAATNLHALRGLLAGFTVLALVDARGLEASVLYGLTLLAARGVRIQSAVFRISLDSERWSATKSLRSWWMSAGLDSAAFDETSPASCLSTGNALWGDADVIRVDFQ